MGASGGQVARYFADLLRLWAFMALQVVRAHLWPRSLLPPNGLFSAALDAISEALESESPIAPALWPPVEVGYFARLLAQADCIAPSAAPRSLLRLEHFRLQLLRLLLQRVDNWYQFITCRYFAALYLLFAIFELQHS